MRKMGVNKCLPPAIYRRQLKCKHVKADFAFHLFLAYGFDTIYTVLYSSLKDYMINLKTKSGVKIWMVVRESRARLGLPTL